MLQKYLYVLLVQIFWVALGLADPTPTITIPWVTDAPDYFKGYGGKVLGAKDESTTYAINCLADMQSCHQFTPDLTVIYAPSTYNLIAQGYRFDLTSGCTLVGSPTPTGATCIEVKHSHNGNSFLTATVLVPGDGSDSTIGIYPAPLPVTDTGNVPAPSGATETQAPVETQTPSTTDIGNIPAPSEVIGTQTPLNPVSTTEDQKVSVTGTSVSFSSNDNKIFTTTGSLILATSGASTSYLNATVTAASVGVPTTNQTLPAGANGTATVTMTVLASDIACHCECDCRSASSQAPLPTNLLVVKNYAAPMAAPMAAPVGLMCGLLAVAVFMNWTLVLWAVIAAFVTSLMVCTEVSNRIYLLGSN